MNINIYKYNEYFWNCLPGIISTVKEISLILDELIVKKYSLRTTALTLYKI